MPRLKRLLAFIGLFWPFLQKLIRLKNRLISAILNGIDGLCWSFLDIGGFCWSFLAFAGLFWPFLAFAGLCLPLPAFAGTMDQLRQSPTACNDLYWPFGLFGFFSLFGLFGFFSLFGLFGFFGLFDLFGLFFIM